MKIHQNSKDQRGETLIVLYHKSGIKSGLTEHATLPKAVIDLLVSGDFEGKLGETVFFRGAEFSGHSHILCVGCESDSIDKGEVNRRAGAFAFKRLAQEKVTSASFSLKQVAAADCFVEGFVLASYSFDKYKSSMRQKLSCKELFLCDIDGKQKQIDRVLNVCDAVKICREHSDHPANELTPKLWAKLITEVCSSLPIEVEIWGNDRLAKEGMNSLLAVAKGSAEEPQLIILRYNGAATTKRPLCFVGKGLTFDSGGISLKGRQKMEEMKYDMAGGAAVVGALVGIAKLGLKVNAVGIIAAVENMPGGNATRPGDIVKARNGVTIEINDTDAEGRLVLADALTYAAEQNPQAIVDAATLTGAVSVCLGNVFSGLFSRSDELLERLKMAAAKSGEKLWQLPLASEYESDMEGTWADLVNISSTKGAGSSQAAAFLSHFVDKKIPWAHFDIAATAHHVGERLPYAPKFGASGAMVRTFINLTETFAV